MDKRIIHFHGEGQFEELETFLQEHDKELTSLLEQRILKGKGDPVALIRAILGGSPCTKDGGIQRRLRIYRKCIKLLQTSELSNKQASEITGILMLEADSFPARYLAELATTYVESVKSGNIGNGKSLELLPKLLSAIEAQEMVASSTGKEMSGPDCKSHLVNTLCSSRWSSGSVIHLAAMFKDVHLSLEELRFVLSKLIRMFKDLDIQTLPPLVYQLLLLSTKGHKKMVLEGITNFFAEQDRTYKKQTENQKDTELSESTAHSEHLHHVEGTVILHVSFAAKQDQDLGRELIKILKAGQARSISDMLSPFTVALALSLARIHRFEEQIFDILKTSILKSFKDSARRKESQWVREMVPEESNVEELILDTVQNSVVGWDQVTQGLVQLGFTLMDSFGPKSSFGRVADIPNTSNLSPQQLSCQLGARILTETFKAHKVVREEILEQTLNRVITKATAPVNHFLELLTKLASTHPMIVLDSSTKLREALDYLGYLPLSTCEGFLRAIQPLLRVSATLRDALILVLRKAMFSRQMEARRVAVTGFLLILRNFQILGGFSCSQASQSSFSSSQVMVDVHTPYTASSNEALCLEILGNMRRCLNQQADVRLALYEGLYEVLTKNKELTTPVLSVLSSQFQPYYEEQDDVNPPVELEACIINQSDSVHISEPLAHLLSCICQCVMKGVASEDPEEATQGDNNIRDELDTVLDSLTRRMIKSELEDFELDKSADFSTATSVGIKNNIYALLVLGMYEVLIEYTFSVGDYEKTSCEEVLQLFTNHQRLWAILREKPAGAGGGGAGGGGKRGRPAAGTSSSGGAGSGVPKGSRSLFTLRFITLMLKALFSDNTPSHQESLSILRESLDFKRFMVTVATQKLAQISQTGKCDGAEGTNKEKIVKYCTAMARVLLKHYCEDLQMTGENRHERNKVVAQLALEGFTTIVSVMCTQHQDNMTAFLSSIDPKRDSNVGAETDQAVTEVIHRHIKKYQRMLISIITDGGDNRSLKEAVSLVTVVGNLSKLLPSDSESFKQVQSWVQRVLTEQSIDDPALCRALLVLLIELTAQVKSCVTLIRDLGRDIHSKLGDIDQEVEVAEETNFSAVNVRTASPTVLLLVLSQVDKELDHTEWVIDRLRAEASVRAQATSDDDGPGMTQVEGQEKNVCLQLGHLINAFHETVQSAVPVGPGIEAVLKALTKLYTALGSFTKYYLGLYQQKAGHLSSRFEKLVKLSSANLTQYVYAFITYIQATQSEHLQAAGEKSKKRKKDGKKAAGSAAPAGKSLVMKETRSIPSLIFAMEQYEKFLIQLTKKSKINLMDNFKMSTARDFRIIAQNLQEAIERQEGSSDGEEEGEDRSLGEQESVNDTTDIEAQQESCSVESDEENQEPPAKRNKPSAAANVSRSIPEGKKGVKGKGRGKSSTAK